LQRGGVGAVKDGGGAKTDSGQGLAGRCDRGVVSGEAGCAKAGKTKLAAPVAKAAMGTLASWRRVNLTIHCPGCSGSVDQLGALLLGTLLLGPLLLGPS
jgi:hypothetical protein